MEEAKLKKGKIQKVEDDRITLFNDDGDCEDTFAIYSEFANDIRSNIEVGEKVFYVSQGDQLLGLGLEEAAPPDLQMLYEISPKEKECKYWTNDVGGIRA